MEVGALRVRHSIPPGNLRRLEEQSPQDMAQSLVREVSLVERANAAEGAIPWTSMAARNPYQGRVDAFRPAH